MRVRAKRDFPDLSTPSPALTFLSPSPPIRQNLIDKLTIFSLQLFRIVAYVCKLKFFH